MLSKWQFNVLFFVAVGGAILLLIGPEIGIDNENPNAVLGIGAILTYVLSQKNALTKHDDKKTDSEPQPDKKEEGDGLR